MVRLASRRCCGRMAAAVDHPPGDLSPRTSSYPAEELSELSSARSGPDVARQYQDTRPWARAIKSAVTLRKIAAMVSLTRTTAISPRSSLQTERDRTRW